MSVSDCGGQNHVETHGRASYYNGRACLKCASHYNGRASHYRHVCVYGENIVLDYIHKKGVIHDKSRLFLVDGVGARPRAIERDR